MSAGGSRSTTLMSRVAVIANARLVNLTRCSTPTFGSVAASHQGAAGSSRRNSWGNHHAAEEARWKGFRVGVRWRGRSPGKGYARARHAEGAEGVTGKRLRPINPGHIGQNVDETIFALDAFEPGSMRDSSPSWCRLNVAATPACHPEPMVGGQRRVAQKVQVRLCAHQGTVDAASKSRGTTTSVSHGLTSALGGSAFVPPQSGVNGDHDRGSPAPGVAPSS